MFRSCGGGGEEGEVERAAGVRGGGAGEDRGAGAVGGELPVAAGDGQGGDGRAPARKDR